MPAKKKAQKETSKTKTSKNSTDSPKETKNEIKLTPEQQKQVETVKKEIESFQKKVLEKFDKYILGIALLPPKKEEPDNIQVLTLIDDSDSEKMPKAELKTKLGTIIEGIGKEINPKLVSNSIILSEVWENCYDGKSEILEIIAKSAIMFDRGMLAAMKIGDLHKKMVLSKFEKYIVAYALFGSLTRGEATDKSDIDVAIIIDDTDVKRMTRAELKDKLRAIIIGMGIEAGEITGIQNKLNIQVYILTDFWESIKDANPVIFTVLRDGIPFYDRGIFMPWKQLLTMGKIKPSPEAIDMFMNAGDEMIKRIRGKIRNLIESDIYWSTLTPSQAALMVYGIPPPTPKETIKLMEEIFVKKEEILEPEYVEILKQNRKYYKDLEHGIIKDVTGAQVDKLLDDSEKYLKRIKKLFDELYEKKEKESFKDVKDNILSATRDLLLTQDVDKVKDADIEKEFQKHIIEKGIIPNKFLTILKEILEKIENKKITKNELSKLRKDSAEYLKFVIETIQRIKIKDFEKLKLKIFYKKDKYAELIIAENKVFLTKDMEKRTEIEEGKIVDGKISNLKKIEIEKLDSELEKIKNFEKPKINKELMASLEKIFGEDFSITN
ncbi:nucleotidyltransferase domain-containing protein [Candidatus Woesearchaeota archaeon]|nr:nucleotidyltransferase domain-containing protein [Candidatus Woesearchaeota archaeon]